MPRRFFVGLALVALAIGVAVLVYSWQAGRGPGQSFVRGHVGDVAATMLLYALLSLAWRSRVAARAVATFAIATAIEIGQTLWHVDGAAGELVLGSTFDAFDLVAYAAGIAIAGWSELTARAARARRSPA